MEKANPSTVVAEENQTAIILLDFQNEFAKKGGKLHESVSMVMEETDMLQKVPEIVDVARKMGAIVIHSPVVMKVDQKFNEITEEATMLEPKNKYFEQDGLFTEKTWNCDFVHELEPTRDDYILHDRSNFSAFAGTALQSIIKRNNVKNLFVMGYQTDVCILDTAKDASDLAPDVKTYIVSDCCASQSLEEHNFALKNSIVKYATVVDCAAAKRMIYKLGTKQRLAVKENPASDEWLLIERIFSAADADDEETIGIEELIEIVQVASENTRIFNVVSTYQLETMNKEEDACLVSRDDLYKILFERKERSTFFEKLPMFIIMGLLPFFYAFSTCLPFIFIPVEIVDERGGELWQVGVVLGSYQTCRALSNLLIVALGGNDPFKRLEIFMVLLGLFGWLVMAISDGLLFVSDSPWLLLALCGVGLSETIVILQGSVITETKKESPAGIADESIVASRFGLQYIAVPCGAVAAYIGGGRVYQKFGFSVTCWVGVFCHVAQVVGAFVYLCLAKNSAKKAMAGDQFDEKDTIRSTIYRFQAWSIIAEHANDVASGASNALVSEPTGFNAAAKKAASDHVLTHALRELYQQFFIGDDGSYKKMDPVLCMDNMLREVKRSRNKKNIGRLSTNRGDNSLRPAVMAVERKEVAKLVLFIMQSRGEEQSLKPKEFITYWAPRVFLSMHNSSEESSVSVVWPYMTAVVLTHAVMALNIGTFLSTALLMYVERFGLETGKVGLLLGIGEGCSMFVLLGRNFLASLSEKRQCNRDTTTTTQVPGGCGGVFSTIFERPLHVPLILFVLSIASMGFSIENLIVAIVCQMVMSGMNDLSVTLLNELIATSIPADKFQYYQGLGQNLRWLGNMVSGILGPILFGVNASFPFLIFGVLVFVWALVLWRLMYVHAKKCELSNSYDEDYGESTKNIHTSTIRTSTPDGFQHRHINPIMNLFQPFLPTTVFPWHVLEQKYYSENKEEIEEKLNSTKKAQVDISMLEHRVRRMGAALKMEQSQRRALEDRMHAAQFHRSAATIGDERILLLEKE